MKKGFSFWTAVIGFVVVSGIFTPIHFAHAQETWAGPFSFTVKITSQEEDDLGNEKLFNSNQAFSGTLSLFIEDDNLATNGVEGCYLKFEGDDGVTSICITEVAGISTESAKSKSEKGLLVGIGEFENEVEGRKVKGIAYGDLKVTLKQNSSNDLISIALSGKVGGGANQGDDNFVFSATLNNTTLTKLAPAPF